MLKRILFVVMLAGTININTPQVAKSMSQNWKRTATVGVMTAWLAAVSTLALSSISDEDDQEQIFSRMEERSKQRWEVYIRRHTQQQPSRPGVFDLIFDLRGNLEFIEMTMRSALALQDPFVLRIRHIIDVLEESPLATKGRTPELIGYLRQLITNNAEVREDINNAVNLSRELLEEESYLKLSDSDGKFMSDTLSEELVRSLASTTRQFLIRNNID